MRYEPEEHLLANEAHFRIVRNRRGYIKRAYCRDSMSLDRRPSTRLGMSFEQMLPSGPVWALGGVTGSK